MKSVLSGSTGDGFGVGASDVDFMFWWTDHHVICDLNHANRYNIERSSLIIMEYSEDHPGLTMLQLLTPTNNIHVQQSCVRINNGLYISSSRYREETLPVLIKDSIQHGPCASGKMINLEYDCAHCFACKHWPPVATSFTLRCQSQAWPPDHVLREIINSGCHVVPIGFKGSPQEDCEWRISFSLAEQKLVYCMNHTQFMCYGLLKIFLKEVLTIEDTNGQPLLCSYFMKTVLFWVIQKNTVIDWNPSNLLSGFWLCFKFLLSCVYRGYLPNFFIAENNMFISKVYGHSQQLVYDRLFEMYKLGTACLLHCHSLRDCLTQAIFNRQYVLSTDESDIISEFQIDQGFCYEIHMLDLFDRTYSDTQNIFTSLCSAVRILNSPHVSQWERAGSRKFISSIIRYIVYDLSNTSIYIYNKRRLKVMYTCLNLLKVSQNMGFASDMIYLPLFLYSLGKYTDAVTCLNIMKRFIAQPYLMFPDFVNEERYTEEVGRRTLRDKMSRAFAMHIKLQRFMLEEELELEYRVTARNFINVPPYVMTLMLLVLCYRGNPHKQQKYLYELCNLLHYNQGNYFAEPLGDISWQILGICQQICGDHDGALLSYQNSLMQFPFHEIQEATYYRIQDIQYRIQQS